MTLRHWIAAALLSALALATPSAAQTVRVEIEIEGVEDPLRENARAFLTLADVAEHHGRLEPTRLRDLHETAPSEIKRALEPFGYYRAVIDSELETGDSVWVARYNVQPGPALYIERLDIQLTGDGRGEGPLEQALREFPLRKGDVLRHAAYREGKSGIMTTAISLGYLEARYDTAQIRIDMDEYAAVIVLHLETGPMHVFGDITFNQDVIDPSLLRSYVPFEPGDRYSTEKLVELQSNLSETPYFSRVEVRPQGEFQREGIRVPIVVDLEPRSGRRYEIGLGYGTDTGFRGRGAVEFRRLNRRGHRAQAEATFSFIERSITGRYRIPRPYPSTQMLTFFAGFRNLSPESSRSDQIRVGGSLDDTWRDWRIEVTLAYEHETFEVGADTASSDLVMPELGVSQTRANDPVFPTHGHRLDLELAAAHDAVPLSSATFLRIASRGTLVRSLAPRTRLITRAELGYILTSDFRDLPATLRFFAGGDQSVRGYSYNELGPIGPGGAVIGGEVLIVSSVELEQRILERWGLAAFFDAGDALDSFSFDLEYGTGIGLRWISPVGLVRLDGAFAVSQPGTPFRLHIKVGPNL